MKYLIYSLFCLMMLTIPLFSQDENNGGTENTAAVEEENTNEIGLFLGATSFTGAGSWTSFTTALEYEHLFIANPTIFIGAYGEYVTGDHSEFLFGVPIGVELSGLKLYFAPSLDFEKETPEVPEGENLKESTTKFFVRFGTGYKFQFSNVSLTPNIALDIISSKTFVVYGLTLGIGF
jgi:hypothetical protein